MSEMIERVAKAAYSSLFIDGDKWPEVLCSVSAEQFRKAARAAIEAMREPTQIMINAGESCDDEGSPNDGDFGRVANAEEHWQAMIDAAL